MKNYFDLTGRVALITGGSSGLGVQFAKALGSQGAKLALVARRLEKLEEVKKELEALGYEVYIDRCDVTDFDEIGAVVGRVKEHYGTIDILVNNAGIALATPADQWSDKDWLAMMDTNLNSVMIFSREVGKIMKENHYGRIINIGSIHSNVAFNGNYMTAYCTTKGGVLMFTKALATEWAKDGITVNAIGPGYFASEMTAPLLDNAPFQEKVEVYCPMGRTGSEGELDTAVLYFASAASSYTTGQILTVDGGWTAI